MKPIDEVANYSVGPWSYKHGDRAVYDGDGKLVCDNVAHKQDGERIAACLSLAQYAEDLRKEISRLRDAVRVQSESHESLARYEALNDEVLEPKGL